MQSEKVRPSSHRRLGVLGGMGPLATADFFQKLTQLTEADSDQGHIPAVVVSLPQIPDRTAAILNAGASPLPAMIEALLTLEAARAERIVMPCNTAHHWFEELQAATALPLIHIVDAVADALHARGLAPGAAVGLLATDGTLETGIYPKRLRRHGYRCLTPSPRRQAAIMAVIGAVKSGRSAAGQFALGAAVTELIEAGCDAVVLACTELPLVLPASVSDVLIDATEALALACLHDRDARDG